MTEPASGVPSLGGIGTAIPHFFFDAIGRIVPGVYLVAVTAWIFWPDDWTWTAAKEFLFSGPGLAIGIIGSLSLSYIVGFLLGAASSVVEWLWSGIRPWKKADIMSHEGFVSAFEATFHVRVDTSGGEDTEPKIEQCAEACHYYLWEKSRSLGVISSRWDAEALSSRSIFLASLVPITWASRTGHFEALAIFALSAVAALISYAHYRKRRVVTRLAMFQAIVAKRKSISLANPRFE